MHGGGVAAHGRGDRRPGHGHGRLDGDVPAQGRLAGLLQGAGLDPAQVGPADVVGRHGERGRAAARRGPGLARQGGRADEDDLREPLEPAAVGKGWRSGSVKSRSTSWHRLVRQACSFRSHRTTSGPPSATASCRPSGLKATVTSKAPVVSRSTRVPARAGGVATSPTSQSRAPSELMVASQRPSGLKDRSQVMPPGLLRVWSRPVVRTSPVGPKASGTASWAWSRSAWTTNSSAVRGPSPEAPAARPPAGGGCAPPPRRWSSPATAGP